MIKCKCKCNARMIDSGELGLALSGGNSACRSVMDFPSSRRNWESLSANPAGTVLVGTLSTPVIIIQVSSTVGFSSIGQCVGSTASRHSQSTSRVVGEAPHLVSRTRTLPKAFTLSATSSMRAISVDLGTLVSSKE